MFDGILSSLRRHKDIVECRANLAQYRLYQEDVAEFRLKLADNVKREEVKKLMAVKEWLAVGELPQIDHEKFCKTRAECATTARWITQHETIKHWTHSDIPNSPVVWVYGIPGAGEYRHNDHCSTLTNHRQNYTSVSRHRGVQV
jgi:hypothetical protein